MNLSTLQLCVPNITAADIELVMKYRSPSREYSLLKEVPVEIVDDVRSILQRAFPDKTFRVRYRGPRAGDTGRSEAAWSRDCLKAKAVSGSIYSDSKGIKLLKRFIL